MLAVAGVTAMLVIVFVVVAADTVRVAVSLTPLVVAVRSMCSQLCRLQTRLH
jgi:hypothetical protein